MATKRSSVVSFETPEEKTARALKVAESLKGVALQNMCRMSRDRGAAQIRWLAAPAFRIDRDRAHAELLEGQKQHEAGFVTDRRLDHLQRAFYDATGKLNCCLGHNETVNALIDSCPDQQLCERWQTLRRKKRSLLQHREQPLSQVRDLENTVHIMKNRIAILKEQAEGAVGSDAKNYFKEALAQRQGDVERLEQELSFARGEVSELEQQRLAFEAEKAALTAEMCMVGAEEHDPENWD